MDVHIGEIDTTVRAVDDRSLLSPEVLDAVAQAVLERLEQRRRLDAARRDEATLWGSVREGGLG
ncbi:hypothetical protein [Nocardia jinanensis]|uniref:Uncharacterized protein n=1 Tax=Nocardia jinanensis TaxID=382504 RepID=A0A917VU89_9NOCA|nr:hypothetical protein [Nocardia jinanensis]GGL14686.1 hypothetical protein GCM10011588_31520 [Nocardia jinanensis]